MGYERTSLDDIVRRAGGSKSTIYNEFGGKTGLFVAAVEEACSTFPVVNIDFSKLNMEESLTKFGEVMLGFVTSGQAIALDRLILSESISYPEIGLAWYKNGPQRTQEVCAHIIASHMGETNKTAIPPLRLAACFHNMLLWDIQHRLMAGIPVSNKMIRQTVRDAVQILLGSISERQL
jgi:AcrR family transcriptional regulator